MMALRFPMKILFLLPILLSIGTETLWAEEVYPELFSDRYNSSKVCGECHGAIYNSWKNSLHARSLNDPIFYTSYLEAYKETRGEAKNLCLSCHAPTVLFSKDFDEKEDITKEGITCDFCHTLRDVVLNSKGLHTFRYDISAIKRGPLTEEFPAPNHDVAYSELHKGPKLCAGCHEYLNEKGVPILETYSEWKASPYKSQGKTCQKCHMPIVKGLLVSTKGSKRPRKEINLHMLAGGSSLAQLKKAIVVRIAEVKRLGSRILVSVDVENKEAGHKVPTGLPIKWLTLTVTAKRADGKETTRKVVYEKVLVDSDGNRVEKAHEVFLEAAKIVKDNRIAPSEVRRENFWFFVPKGIEVLISAKISYEFAPYLLEKSLINTEINMAEKVFLR